MKKMYLFLLLLSSCASLNSWKLEDKIINKLSKNNESFLNNKSEIHRISFVSIDEMRNGIEIEFSFKRNDTTYMCIERYTNKYSFFDSELRNKKGIVLVKTSY